MVDESVNEPCDPVEVKFWQLEQHFTNVNQNVNLLMAALRNKLGIFGEDGGLNVEEKSKWGSRNWEDIENQSKKEHIKYQHSSSVMNQSLLKMEETIDIKSYHGKIEALNLNH